MTPKVMRLVKSLATVDPFVPNSALYKVAVKGGRQMSAHLMYSDVEHNNNKVMRIDEPSSILCSY